MVLAENSQNAQSRVSVKIEREMPSNPVKPISTEAEWKGDYVYFGKDWNPVNGVEKRRKWRVLQNDGKNLLLMTDEAIAEFPYNDVNHLGEFKNTWKSSTLRKYLNNEFVKKVFSKKEQKYLQINHVENATSQWAEFDSGNDTDDRVYILSPKEFKNKAYGFHSTDDTTRSRMFHLNNGRYVDVYTRTLWSMRNGYPFAFFIKADGNITAGGSWFANPVTWSKSILPVIKISLKCPYWSTVANAVDESVKKTVRGYYIDFGEELSSTAVYNDEYFKISPVDGSGTYKEQPGLAKLSMLAAAAAYYKKYATDFLNECKFNKIEYKTEKLKENDNDHVSFAVGFKDIGNIKLIAILVRGTKKNYEWVSNFNLGTGKVHKGFSEAEKELYENLIKYLKKEKIKLNDNTRFWVTGHSRGAAVGNLLAKRLTNKYGKERVYAYTFATPRVATNAKKSGYENIYNYLNIGDFVTEVAPNMKVLTGKEPKTNEWSYNRYGVDITLKTNKKKMKNNFKNLTAKVKIEYKGFGEEGKKSLLKAFISYAGKNAKSYYKERVYLKEASFKSFKPVQFFQEGIGYFLAGKTVRGIHTASNIASCDAKAGIVFGKMVVDGAVNGKFAHAHCPSSYIAWVNAIY